MHRISALFLVSILVACAGGGAQNAPTTPPPQPPAVQPATQAPPPAPPKLRLGDSVTPTQYALDLTIVPTQDAFDGVVDVDVQLKQATSSFWMNGADLTIKDAKLTTPDGQTLSLHPIAVPADAGELVGFTLDRPVGPSAGHLRIAYSGKISAKESQGIFKQQDGADWYAFTQFESTDARRAFPCFDEPAFKVPWQLTLHVRKGDVALSNTPIASETDEPNGLKAVRFQKTKPLPSYLVAFGVGPFEIVDAGKSKSGKPVRVVTPRGHSTQATYAVEVSAQILSALEDYFGTPYPYDKLDCLFIPQTVAFGAMENPGLVTFVEQLLLSKPDEDSLQRQRAYAGTAAHEFAHQWFGDLVTMVWWNDIWLNESFASWAAQKVIARWQPTWGESVSRVWSRSHALGLDSLATARAIRQPIETQNDIVNAFDGITYSKGESVLYMFENWLGEDTFRKGVQRYIQAHAWGNATADDFVAAMTEAAGTDLKAAFSSFLDQPGAPLVSAELACDKGATPKVVLEQKRYLPAGSTASADERWQMPVCVKYVAGKVEGRECTLMTTPRAEIELKQAKTCPEYVFPNADEAGYYRILYKGAMLGKLIKDGGKRLSLAERVGMVGDVSALVENGSLNYGDALQLVSPLLADGNRFTTSAAVGLVGGMRFHLVPAELLPNYRRFVLKTFGAKARELGFTPKAKEDDDTRLLRTALVAFVAMQGEDRELAAEARKLAEKWLDDHGAIAPEMVESVLVTAGRFGDAAFWDRLHQVAKKADDHKTRGRILAAMGNMRDPALVKRNLDLVLTDEFDIREATMLFYGALASEGTRQMAYDFAKTHYDQLAEKIPRQARAYLMHVGSVFCDEAHRADVEAFFQDKAADMLGGPRVLANVLEGVSLCITTKKANEASVAAFLRKY